MYLPLELSKELILLPSEVKDRLDIVLVEDYEDVYRDYLSNISTYLLYISYIYIFSINCFIKYLYKFFNLWYYFICKVNRYNLYIKSINYIRKGGSSYD